MSIIGFALCPASLVYNDVPYHGGIVFPQGWIVDAGLSAVGRPEQRRVASGL